MTDIDDLIARLRAATEGVTPGPWKHERTESRDYGSFSYWVPGICTHVDSAQDARFIAAARQLVPEAAAALEALRAENERLRMEAHMAKSAVGKLEAMIAKHTPR